MLFGKAIEKARRGNVIMREGWNGKGIYIFNFFFAGLKMKADEDFSEEIYDTTELCGIVQMNSLGGSKWFELQPFFILKTAKDTCVPWVPSQTDMTANDWIVAL